MLECNFYQLRVGDVVNMLEGGVTQSFEFADPRWAAEFTTRTLSKDERAIYRAWNETLRGSLHPFLAHDYDRPFPGAYPNGFDLTRATGGVFDGLATVTGLTATTISVSTLPANFILQIGDYIGLIEAGKRGLHRIVEAVTGNSGGAVTVTVEPAVLTNVFTTAALANFSRPEAEMIVQPGSFKCATTARQQTSASWTGIQKLY